MIASGQNLTVLVLGTEWFSAHGGLSTLNRELCIALRSLGHDVWCFVPTAQPEEKAHAQRRGVNLIEANHVSGLPEYSRLLIPPPLPDGLRPDLIIGHGRVTGPAAAVQARYRFEDAAHLAITFGAAVTVVHAGTLLVAGTGTHPGGKMRLESSPRGGPLGPHEVDYRTAVPQT